MVVLNDSKNKHTVGVTIGILTALRNYWWQLFAKQPAETVNTSNVLHPSNPKDLVLRWSHSKSTSNPLKYQ